MFHVLLLNEKNRMGIGHLGVGGGRGDDTLIYSMALDAQVAWAGIDV